MEIEKKNFSYFISEIPNFHVRVFSENGQCFLGAFFNSEQGFQDTKIWIKFIFQVVSAGTECVYPSGHSFFTAKYEILQLYPNGRSFFYSEMQNNENCTQAAIRFPQQNKKCRNVPKLPFILWLQKLFFKSCFETVTFFLTTD